MDSKGTTMMQMYIWESKMLQKYAMGKVMAVAPSPAEARKKILDAAPAYIAERYQFGYDAEEDARDLDAYMNKLTIDLCGPYRIEEVAFFEGSDW